jgi:hypothetical protein
MALPVAVVTYDPTPIPFADLGLSPTVDFDALTSSDGDGTSIVSWQWTLIAKPTDSNASLLNATTNTCTLTGIDLPGGYRVHCQIVNDIGQSSYTLPVPSQSGTTPFAFTPPPLSSFGLIYVTTQYSALKKVAPGARDWLPDGLWPVVDELDELRGDHGTLYDEFHGHGIDDHDTTATGAELNTLTGGSATDAAALHTHATIPATTIGVLNTDTINGETDPTAGIDIGTGTVTIRGTLIQDGGTAPLILHNDYYGQTTIATVGAEVLGDYTIPAGTVGQLGDEIVLRAVWFTSNDTNTKVLSIRWATATLATLTVNTANQRIVLEYRVVLTTAGPAQLHYWEWSQHTSGTSATPTKTSGNTTRADNYASNVLVEAMAATTTLAGGATLVSLQAVRQPKVATP